MFESASGCWDGARVGAARDGEALSTCRLMLLDTLLQHLHLAPTPACGHLHLAPCTLHLTPAASSSVAGGLQFECTYCTVNTQLWTQHSGQGRPLVVLGLHQTGGLIRKRDQDCPSFVPSTVESIDDHACGLV